MARKKRCTGWRSVDYRPHRGQGHVPLGTQGGHACRKCWVPCRNKTQSGAFCDECVDRLSTDPRPNVRRSLAGDPKAPDRIVSFLTTDGDETVAIVARTESERRGLVVEMNTNETITIIEDPWA